METEQETHHGKRSDHGRITLPPLRDGTSLAKLNSPERQDFLGFPVLRGTGGDSRARGEANGGERE